jgi:hypothetical protein
MPAQTVIQLRRDTAANWSSVNPVLAAGEVGYDSTNNQIKIGNGSALWNSLPYASGAGGASVNISQTAPTDPEAGDVWFNSTEGRAYIYYDNVWVDLNPGIAGPGVASGGTTGQILTKVNETNYNTSWEDLPESAAVISSATPPANTTAIWFNTENGNTYIYYDSFWTSIAGSTGAPIISDTAPVSPVLGMQWFNSSNGKSYIYFSGAWVEVDSNGNSAVSSGNALINGAFEINQRRFTSVPTSGYHFDRWRADFAGGSVTITPQVFTPGLAPVSGYESANFLSSVTSGQSGTGDFLAHQQRIESVRSFAGQTVTISFFARANTGTPRIGVALTQNFGVGGSPTNEISTGVSAIAISNSWARYSVTHTVPSILGRTLGTTHDGFLGLELWFSSGATFASRASNIGIQNNTFDIWGVQLETGPVATPFKRNAPSIQAELAACQRYYQRWQADTNFAYLGGFINPSAGGDGPGFLTLFTPLRATPASVSFGNIALSSLSDSRVAITNITINAHATASNGMLQFFVVGGLSPGTLYKLQANNSAAGFIALSAEL